MLVILTWGLTERINSLTSLSVVFFLGTVHKGYRCLDPSSGRVYISRHVIFDELSFPFAERPGSTSPGFLTSPSDSATPNTTGSVITLPLPITQDPQAAKAPPTPAAVTDTLTDVGTTYATADTTVDANSSEVLSDVPSIPFLVDLSAPATDDSIPSSTLVPPAQQLPAPYTALLASLSPHEPTLRKLVRTVDGFRL